MQEETTLSERLRAMIPVAVSGIAQNIMMLALAGALLAALYLLFGLFGGGLNGFASMNAAEKTRILANIAVASQVIGVGLAVGAIAAALVFFSEEVVGYALLLGGLAVGMGVSFLYGQFFAQGAVPNKAIQATLDAFTSASRFPLIIGALLVVRDVVGRLATGLTTKPAQKQNPNLAYGRDAAREKKEKKQQQRILGNCYEGPFCREFVRVHCPIFQKKQACWRVRRGCYCEEDIVSNAAAKVSGVHLEMAPNAALNFANPPVMASAEPGGAAKTAAPTPVTLVRGGTVSEAPTGLAPVAPPPPSNPFQTNALSGLGSAPPTANPFASPPPNPFGAPPPPNPFGAASAETPLSEIKAQPHMDAPALPTASANPFQAPPPVNPLNRAGANAPRRVDLTWGQKKERCNNCVIYNEHQREKYQVLMPFVLGGTVAAALVFNVPIRAVITQGLGVLTGAMRYLSFGGESANRIGGTIDPGAGVEWFLFAAIIMILISKTLQVLEWAMFKVKL